MAKIITLDWEKKDIIYVYKIRDVYKILTVAIWIFRTFMDVERQAIIIHPLSKYQSPE